MNIRLSHCVLLFVLLSVSCQTFAAKKWSCDASCNVQAIEGKAPSTFPDRVTGTAIGKTEAAACTSAKRVATQSAPKGTYARHCQCKCGKK